MPKIRVKITKLGDSKIEVEGATGSSCVQATAGVEAALAGREQPRELQPEYYVENEQLQENG